MGKTSLSALQHRHIEDFLTDFSEVIFDHATGTDYEEDAAHMLATLEDKKDTKKLLQLDNFCAYKLVKYGANDVLIANTAEPFIELDEKRIARRWFARGAVYDFFRCIDLWAEHLDLDNFERWHYARERLVENRLLDPERMTIVKYYMSHRKPKR